MAITISERLSPTVDAQSGEVSYLVVADGADAGTLTEGDAFNAVAGAAPPTRNGLTGQNIAVRSELVPGTIFDVSATYGGNEPKNSQQADVEYEFSYQAPAEKIYQSLFTRGVYGRSGPVSSDKFFGQINVKCEDGKNTVEGEDLKAGTTTNTWIYKPKYADITTAYQLGVESVMGAVNAFPFKGRPARSMRLVSVDGGAAFSWGIQPKWHIKFGFQYSANRFNFSAGGIAIPFKGGHDLLWGYYGLLFDDAGDPEDHLVLPQPKYMIVEQVFPEVNFAALNIGI